MLRLLPVAASETQQLGGPGRPWSIRYGSTRAVLRWNDAGRWRAFGFSDDEAVASLEWLHRMLGDLSATGFIAPRPIDHLDGRSIALVDGGLWELLSHVPGRAMGWTDREIHAAGALLARFHDASARLPTRPQRPGAQPFAACEPAHPEARVVRSRFERDSVTPDAADVLHAVIHGDATQSNVVVAADGSFHLVDFAIAYNDHTYADIGSALWRNGRSSADAVTYDGARAAGFVRGYDSVRPLGARAARAIVTSMLGRGLQLQHRLELRHGRDETVMQRLLAIHAAHDELVASIDRVLT